jgi:hypothetical protein
VQRELREIGRPPNDDIGRPRSRRLNSDHRGAPCLQSGKIARSHSQRLQPFAEVRRRHLLRDDPHAYLTAFRREESPYFVHEVLEPRLLDPLGTDTRERQSGGKTDEHALD